MKKQRIPGNLNQTHTAHIILAVGHLAGPRPTYSCRWGKAVFSRLAMYSWTWAWLLAGLAALRATLTFPSSTRLNM